jgi:hypothetical protein
MPYSRRALFLARSSFVFWICWLAPVTLTPYTLRTLYFGMFLILSPKGSASLHCAWCLYPYSFPAGGTHVDIVPRCHPFSASVYICRLVLLTHFWHVFLNTALHLVKTVNRCTYSMIKRPLLLPARLHYKRMSCIQSLRPHVDGAVVPHIYGIWFIADT